MHNKQIKRTLRSLDALRAPLIQNVRQHICQESREIDNISPIIVA